MLQGEGEGEGRRVPELRTERSAVLPVRTHGESTPPVLEGDARVKNVNRSRGNASVRRRTLLLLRLVPRRRYTLERSMRWP